jgi:hypothetical protein
MKMYQATHLLNQKAFFFGLDRSDLVALALVLILSQKIGLEAVYKGLPMLLTILAAVMLIPIRLRHKKRTIRGYIKMRGRDVKLWLLN